MMQLDFERLRSMGLTPALANQAMACAAQLDGAAPLAAMRLTVLHRETVQLHDGAHEHIARVLPRQGSTIETPEHLRNDMPKLSALQAMQRIVTAIGRSLTQAENTWLRSTFKEGVPEDQVNALIEQFTRPAAVAPASNVTGLRAV